MGAPPQPPHPDYIPHDVSRCRGCGALIAWWETPAGKMSPHDFDGTSHFGTCPKAAEFKRKGKTE